MVAKLKHISKHLRQFLWDIELALTIVFEPDKYNNNRKLPTADRRGKEEN